MDGNLVQELFDPTPGDSGSFGYVYVFGDTLYIGAPFDGGGPGVRGPGSVYVYKLNILPGDVDMDGDVGLDDFAALKDNFGEEVLSRDAGDVTGDLQVTLDDFEQLKTNFGNVAAEPVPEPSSATAAAMLAILAGLNVWRRHAYLAVA